MSPVGLRTYPQLGWLDNDQSVEQAKAMVGTTYRCFPSVLKAKRSPGQRPWRDGIVPVLHKSDVAKRRLWARKVTAIFAFYLSILLVAAADREMTREYSTCLEKSNGVTAEMINCILAETRRQDARLNENYKRLISKLATERKKRIG
jgi:hypothetical protein